jgi:hypothetical protein
LGRARKGTPTPFPEAQLRAQGGCEIAQYFLPLRNAGVYRNGDEVQELFNVHFFFFAALYAANRKTMPHNAEMAIKTTG